MSNTRKLTSLIAGCGLIATMGVMPSVAAADDAAPDRAPLILAQSQTFDDATIEAIAAAQVEIREIRTDMQSKLQEAQTAAEQEQMRQSAVQEMVDAIRAQEVSVEEYNTFMEAANRDPELLDRLNDAMSDMSG